jgi:hypothetical protein
MNMNLKLVKCFSIIVDGYVISRLGVEFCLQRLRVLDDKEVLYRVKGLVVFLIYAMGNGECDERF